MWRELSALWSSLEDAEYLHLLLEPLPLFGLGFGLIFLIVSIITKQAITRLLALALITACCLSVQPYVKLRLKSEPRVLALQDPAFHPAIRAQTERRTSTTWIYYATALAGAAALFLGRGGRAVMITGGAIVVCTASFLHALWLHKKECEVYHRNILRYQAPK
jgi:hypothetical protein